ncbi:hypothetical protein [Dysgonomonas massiliensis]|uniref:hypothetical protein n=1 Tax=Dysgonomonas massiliensis TaxID=2040292 RepID=UPI0011AF238D|nr:hypothetical protein [Dysgonomonas massiliensis]
MKKVIFLVITLSCICCCIYAQKIAIDNEQNIADIDGDHIMDSLYYDLQGDSIMVSLSTHGFKSFGLEFNPGVDKVSLSVTDGKFIVHSTGMETTEIESYIYEKETERFRLVSLYKENRDVYGGYTEYSLDLLGSEYEASFSRYDEESDFLREYSNIRMVVDNEPIYWGNFSNLHLPGDEFFNQYKNNYTTAAPDTAIFIGIDKDYDIHSLMGINLKGEGINMTFAANADEIYKGDTICLHFGIFCSQEAGDGNIFYALSSVEGIDKIADGSLAKFYKTNKKEIVYLDFGEDDQLAVDYFLANTTDMTITEYLESSGQFKITQTYLENKLPDYNYEGNLLIEILNIDKGKETFVCKFIIDHTLMRYGITTYYIWDAGINNYKKWQSEDEQKMENIHK